MKEIYSEIEIKSPASVVWNILTDFDDYPNWNPFIKQISGTPREGSQIQVVIAPPNTRAMTFKPTILEYKTGEKIKWLGKLWIPHLFDGEHSLSIKKIDENRVLFNQIEKFSGILVPLLPGLLKNTKMGFELMNQELKKKSEETKP